MTISQIFGTLFEHETQIEAELDALLPTDMRYSKYDRENPFSLYCGYLDLVRPINAQTESEKWKRKYELLLEKIKQRENELDLSLDSQHIYRQMEDSYKNRIAQLEAELIVEKGRSVSVVDDLRKEIV